MAAPTVTAGDKAVTVTWTAPTSSSIITKYTITPFSGATAGASVDVPNVTALPVTSHIVTGLTNGTPYTFTITATNATGTSAASPASAAVIPAASAAATAPATMAAPTAVAGDKTATITWVAPKSDSMITKYTITPSAGLAATIVGTPIDVTVAIATPATSYIVTGLTNGTPYTFTITATNTTGTSAASPASTPVTPKGS